MHTTVPIEDLRAAGFGDEVEEVATAVADYLDDGRGPNVAVVSEPYAGRGSLLEYAESLLDGAAVRVDLDPSAADGEGPQLPGPGGDPCGTAPDGGTAGTTTADGAADRGPDDAGSTEESAGQAAADEPAGALVVSDCHHLFERRIDGFAALDAFLDRLALSDQLVVTSWSSYAWSYLDAVRDVGDTFPVTVEIPRLDATELQTVIEAEFGPDLPAVVDTGRAGRVKTVVFDRHRVGLPGGRSVAVPYPKPNPAWLASWSVRGEEESVEAVVYEKLRRVSRGNPGVAKAIWKRSVRDGEIAPGYIESPTADLSLDDDAAFLLWTVVVMESAGIDRLDRLFADRPVEATLQHLVEREFVTVEGGAVEVAPESLHLAVAALERRGLLW